MHPASESRRSAVARAKVAKFESLFTIHESGLERHQIWQQSRHVDVINSNEARHTSIATSKLAQIRNITLVLALFFFYSNIIMFTCLQFFSSDPPLSKLQSLKIEAGAERFIFSALHQTQ